MLPNFLVVGAEKAGTTWLYGKLKVHPDVFLPETKELHFFNDYSSRGQELKKFDRLGFSWYAEFFRNRQNEVAIGEVTPMYICDPSAIPRIARTLNSAKIIVCFRDPFFRLKSHFQMAREKGHTELNFEDLLTHKREQFLYRGQYGAQMRRLLTYIPTENVKVLFFEDIEERPVGLLRDVLDFLGVDSSFAENIAAVETNSNSRSGFKSKKLGRAYSATAELMRESKLGGSFLDVLKRTGFASALKTFNSKKPEKLLVARGIEKSIRRFYSSDIAALERILDVDLSHWKPT